LNLSRIGLFNDEEIVSRLSVVKGIGVWTAQMFLMFSLGRPNVFPGGDLCIRKAIGNLYTFDDLPNEEQAREIAERWKPYCTVACWYCWRSLDNN
jgi:DNA-3-methyladenine glycosylase II